MNKRNIKSYYGFTLIELLVTVAIIVLVVGITFPAISKIRHSTVVSSGVNTVKAGITSARSYALKKQNFMSTHGSYNRKGTFSGTAIIFTPANEMRIVINDEQAKSSIRRRQPMETLRYSGDFLDTKVQVSIEDAFNGYKDIETRSYIKIPSECGVVGVTRDEGGDLHVLTPPFALRFDQFGHQVVGVINADYPVDKVFYNGDYDDEYEVRWNDDRGSRPVGYNVELWDPSSPDYQGDTDNINDVTKKHELPFEQIESVLAIIVYNKVDFDSEGGVWSTRQIPDTFKDTSDPDPEKWLPYDSIEEWMQLNGRLMMFSRMTGTLMDEYKEKRDIR